MNSQLKQVRLAISLLVVLSSTSYAANSVVIPDMTVAAGAIDVVIPVLISNDNEASVLSVPLVLRDLNPGGFPTAVKLSVRERLISALFQIAVQAQYSSTGNQCKDSTAGGFRTELFNDTLKHATTGSPWGVFVYRSQVIGQRLDPGSDTLGSIMMTVDIGLNGGAFEVDSTCTDPSHHLSFIEASANNVVTPSFSMGTITVTPPLCNCPHQADLGPRSVGFDGVINLVDVVTMVDEIFFNGPSAATDPGCPNSRSDIAPDATCGDGAVDILDLTRLIDYALISGGPLCSPCVE